VDSHGASKQISSTLSGSEWASLAQSKKMEHTETKKDDNNKVMEHFD